MAEAIIAVKNIYIKNRNLFLILLKIIISAGLLTFILVSVDIKKAVSVFTSADKFLLLPAFLLGFLNIFLQYSKWKLVCSSLLNENNAGKIITSLFYGFSAGSFTPARIGEYIGRAVPFSDKSLIEIASAVFIDKMFSLFIVLIFGAFSFLLFMKSGVITISAFIVLTALLLYLLSNGLIITIKDFLSRWKWSRNIFSSLALFKQMNNRFRLKLSILSLLFYLCFIIQFALLVSAFSHHYNLLSYVWTGSLVMFAKSIIPPISFGELGIREGVSVYFLKHIGETAAAGFNASIFLFLINILFPALIGLIFLLRRK